MKSISVIVTVYNKDKYIADSLASLLSQISAPDELIVIDDASSDHSVKVVGSIRPRLEDFVYKCMFMYLDKNVGAAEARNMAIREATSDYIVFLDADDRYENSYIYKLKSIVNSSDQIGMIASKVRMDSSGIEYPSNHILKFIQTSLNLSYVQDPFKALAIESLFVGGGNLCFKRSNAPIELFDPNERNFEEWDFYYRVLKISMKNADLFVYNPNVSYFYNDTDTHSLSRNFLVSYKDVPIPKLITRLSDPIENKYKSLLISMWFYNSIHRLKTNKHKILFIYYRFSILIKAGYNRYTFGALMHVFFPEMLLKKVILLYKRYRFSKC